MNIPSLRTSRLLLRGWTDADREAFAALNADPDVMHHFPAALSRAESDALVDTIQERWVTNGWGLWATEVRDGGPLDGRFIGFIGLNPAPAEYPCAPATEIGWRLASFAWGHGYATEGALRVVEFAFEEAGLDELVSFTTFKNERSQAVMRRIGMTRDPDGDFVSTRVPADWPERFSVLYRLRAPSTT
ncbi:GNAT family N-acetyltransferase [Spongisporangium articulatum]|uniref:GNAT family N-acetyltransferase n=1 Tax=Spongisporangium articulatum TaxID=3362603 RepID=A0ABW8AQX9_9ACTN